jgi:hypothetical protein
MRVELQMQIYEKFPKLFRQKDLPMTETCMCWGIECGDGWYWLIYNLADAIQRYVDANKKEQIEAVQVKEKYGGLRFYVDSADDVVLGMIDFAEHLSYRICESCGSTEGVKQSEGWIKTLCRKCLKGNGNDEK